MIICNGPICKGKEWPETRFEKRSTNKLGRKTLCKMCAANGKNPGFVQGICEFCSKKHDCMFGTGKFCSRLCATGNKSNGKKKQEVDVTLTRICGCDQCPRAGEKQAISEFYARSRGGYKSYCKTCTRMSVRKSQTSFEGIFKMCYNSAKARASGKGREFSITLDDLKKQFEKQNGKCAITGADLKHDIKGKSEFSRCPFNMSLDRIDSGKGYTTENIQWVCVWVQGAKSDWNETEFKQWIVSAAKHIESQSTQ